MNKRLEKAKKLLAEEGITLHTYKYRSGECSCCYGPKIPLGQQFVVVDLSVASNQGQWDSMKGSKSYFNRSGALKVDNWVSFGFNVESFEPHEKAALIKKVKGIGQKCFEAFQKSGFDCEWEQSADRAIKLNSDLGE